MLVEILENAISMGGSRVEIEYKDGKEYIFVYQGNVGYGVASFDTKRAKALFGEMDDLKKEKKVVVSGVPYRLAFSRYESFGEWVHVIEFKPVRGGTAPARRRCIGSA